jgi:hypothetical protein
MTIKDSDEEIKNKIEEIKELLKNKIDYKENRQKYISLKNRLKYRTNENYKNYCFNKAMNRYENLKNNSIVVL